MMRSSNGRGPGDQRGERTVGHAVNIRTAAIDDATSLAALAGELGYPTTTEQMQIRLGTAAAESQHRVFIAELDAIAGWIQVSLMLSLETGQFAEIVGLVVAESERGAGIGGKLVAAAEKWAAEEGCTRIRVRTNVLREKARLFYQRLGYQGVKRQEVFDKALTEGGPAGNAG